MVDVKARDVPRNNYFIGRRFVGVSPLSHAPMLHIEIPS
jgi:hypothetical protein